MACVPFVSKAPGPNANLHENGRFASIADPDGNRVEL